MLTRELEALLKISSIDLTKDLTQILEEILTVTGSAMAAHSGSVMFVDEPTGDLGLIATFGLPTDYIARVHARGIPTTCSSFSTAAETDEYYVVSNLFAEPCDTPWADLGREFGFSAQLVMPLKLRNEIIGLLTLHMAEPHEFAQHEIIFARIAASHAAAVTANARLYALLDDQRRVLESRVHEQKRALEMLWEHKDTLSNILAASPIGIGIVKDRTLSWTNERMMELFGFRPEEDHYLNQSAEVIYASKEEYERVGALFYTQLRDARIAEADAKLKRRDGTLFDGHIIMSFLDPENPSKGAVATITDITWQKEGEKALQESEERFHLFFDTLPLSIVMTDPEGSIVAANRSCCQLLGCPWEELAGMPVATIFSLDESGEGAELCSNILEGRIERGVWDARVQRRDGEIISLRLHLSRGLDAEGHLKHVVVLCEDVTAYERVEEALSMKKQELEHALSELLRLESALADSEEKYREITRFLPDLIYKLMQFES
jgi:PAS domain S-box-containing protein